MKHQHSISALVLSAAVLLSAVSLCGCGESGNAQNPDEPISTAYAPSVPENPVADDAAGQVTSGKKGDTINYSDKVSVVINDIVELDTKSGTGGRILLAEMTITNTGTEKIDCSIGTHFGLVADGGEESLADVIDVGAQIFARQYYTHISSTLQPFNQAIEPGQSVQGYISFKAPATFSELKLMYTPFKYYNNDKVEIVIAEGDIRHYVESFSAANE